MTLVFFSLWHIYADTIENYFAVNIAEWVIFSVTGAKEG